MDAPAAHVELFAGFEIHAVGAEFAVEPMAAPTSAGELAMPAVEVVSEAASV
jgi:hypothetical protein